MLIIYEIITYYCWLLTINVIIYENRLLIIIVRVKRISLRMQFNLEKIVQWSRFRNANLANATLMRFKAKIPSCKGSRSYQLFITH